MIHVLIAAEDTSECKTLQVQLEEKGYTCQTESVFCASCLKKAASADILLLLMKHPAASAQYTRMLREENASALLFVISEKTKEAYVLRAFENGADDFLYRPYSFLELLARIHAHLRSYHPTEQLHSFLDIHIDDLRLHVSVAAEHIAMTKREFELLRYLVLHNNCVASREDILRHVFHKKQNTRIVDVYICSLRAKLKHSQAVISSYRGIGYILEDGSRSSLSQWRL